MADFIDNVLLQASAIGMPLTIPWNRRPMKLGTGFDSAQLREHGDPWKKEKAFDPPSRMEGASIFSLDLDGGIYSFTDGLSAAGSTSSEHMSASLGVTVGNALLSGNVTGSYDKSMQELSNASKASRNASCRIGRVMLAQSPKPSANAMFAFQRSQKGSRAFEDVYGDYFVAGYILGGDAGACLAARSSSSKSVETKTLTVTVKLLFWSESVTTTTAEVHEKAEIDLAFNGYDTLADAALALDMKRGDQAADIQKQSHECMELIENLQQRVYEQLKQLKLPDDDNVDDSYHEALISSGLVVELILWPFRTLSQLANLKVTGQRTLQDNMLLYTT